MVLQIVHEDLLLAKDRKFHTNRYKSNQLVSPRKDKYHGKGESQDYDHRHKSFQGHSTSLRGAGVIRFYPSQTPHHIVCKT